MKRRGYVTLALVSVFATAMIAIVFWARGSGGVERSPAASEALTSPFPPSRERLEAAKRLSIAIANMRKAHLQKVATAAPDELEKELRLRAVLENPTHIKAELRSGVLHWSPTVLAIEDFAFASEERIECGRTLGREITDVCNYSIAMAVERTGAREGVIRHVEAKVTDAQPEAVCDAFADCVSFGRIGKKVPLPETETKVYGITQALQSSPLPGDMRHPEHLRKQLEVLRIQLEESKKGVDTRDGQAMHHVKSLASVVRYLEAKVNAQTPR